ncbi:MAG: hypothetical protein IH940_01100 [Acidobacteria bacterium]|nr:hypothetical protein [Acidobacteriota bacterium]
MAAPNPAVDHRRPSRLAARRAAREERTAQEALDARGALSVVEPARQVSISTYTLGAISLLIIVSAFVGTVFMRVRLAEGQRSIDSLNGQIIEAVALEDELLLEIAQLESPDRIRSVAATRLAMVAPQDVTYLAPVLPERPATALVAPTGDPFTPTEQFLELDEGGTGDVSQEEGQ